jgi:hypothetical protein
MGLKTIDSANLQYEETVFTSIEIIFKYDYLPLRTFLEVNNLILHTHDYLIKLFKLDEESIYKYYRLEITDLHMGSAIISFEPKFEFPNNTKKTAKLEKTIKKFALVAAILGSIAKGQEIYLNFIKIFNPNKEKIEIKNESKTELKPELKKLAKNAGLNIDSLLKENNKTYIYSVQDNLRNIIKGKNIQSLIINGEEIIKPRPKSKGGSFNL